jgi:glycosyltransferase involved in cell wall biosynthesis
MRIAIVTPRFGERLSGGAELLARWFAERLSARGDGVDVFTTCATDNIHWRNDVEPGTEQMGAVTVRRFPLRARDLELFYGLDDTMRRGFDLTDDMEQIWLRNGASSEELEDELYKRADDYDVVLALPYLFGTTYFAYEICPSKCIVIPCLHDEPAAHTRFTQRMLTQTRGLIFNSDAEARLAKRLVPALAPSATVGVGIERRATSPSVQQRRKRRPDAAPSLLYVGRREVHKNFPLMLDHFIRYKARRAGDLRLVLAGGAGDPFPEREDIVEVTPDWDTLDFFADATIFCHPGVNESFSIVLLQAWLMGRPALVHAECEVTREHCERANGGLWFRTYADFETIIDRLLASPELRAQLGRNGRAYVEREYSWDAVLRRFDDALGRLLGEKTSVA